MSLIKCTECGKTYSDKASACPECGCPTIYNIPSGETNEQENVVTNNINDLQTDNFLNESLEIEKSTQESAPADISSKPTMGISNDNEISMTTTEETLEINKTEYVEEQEDIAMVDNSSQDDNYPIESVRILETEKTQKNIPNISSTDPLTETFNNNQETLIIATEESPQINSNKTTVKFFGYKGRMQRNEFWIIYGVFVIHALVRILIEFSNINREFTLMFYIPLFVSFLLILPMMIRRLHDTNNSGWLLLIAIIPFAAFYILYLFIKEGDVSANDYGESNPLKHYTKNHIIILVSVLSVLVISSIFLSLNENANAFISGKVDNKPYTFENGDVYVGEWKNGLMHGKGTYTVTDGTVFSGTWENGKQTGHGTMIYYNGTKYEGMFKDDLFHGTGKVRYVDGSTITGKWIKGRLNGTARIVWSNGDRYEGEVKNNSVMHGYGTFTFANGEKITGRFRDGEYIGK